MEADPAITLRVRAARESIAPMLTRLDDDRRLPAAAIDALVAAGVFKLCVPRSLGGAQATPHTVIAAIEALAGTDASVGWIAMIGATSGLMSVYLDDATAREIYSPADAVTCGVFAPMGRAAMTGAGYKVTGRWAFASGCEHSRWRMGGTLAEGDAPLPSGAPDVRSVMFRADETTIHDTWDTAGLRGTGSHDLSVDGVVVPRERTFSLFTTKVRHDGYALPFFGVLAAGVAAVGLGNARAALDAAIALVQTKTAPGGKKPFSHKELVQLEVARAEARLESSRLLLHHALAAAVAAPDHIAARARLRLAACQAATESAAVTSAAYELGGGSAVYAKSPLARKFRDAHVVTHHLMVSQTALVMAGRALLGRSNDARSEARTASPQEERIPQRGKLAGQIALVTGASRGVGKGIALGLGEAGATVYVTGRTVAVGALPGTIGETADAVTALGGRGIAVACDHADDAQVAALLARIHAEHGALDILVNNAFAVPAGKVVGNFWELPIADWDTMHRVGLRSHYVATWHAAPAMIANKRGLVVHVSSFGAKVRAVNVAYGVGKSGVDRMARDMAADLAPHGITCVALWPGIVATERHLAESLGLVPKESAQLSGRAVAAIAADPARQQKSGKSLVVAELAREYGFSDLDGGVPTY